MTKQRKFVYIVWDAGRKSQAFWSRREAERHRLAVTCGRCKPPQSCPHYYESFVWKTGYTVGKLHEVLKNFRAHTKYMNGIN